MSRHLLQSLAYTFSFYCKTYSSNSAKDIIYHIICISYDCHVRYIVLVPILWFGRSMLLSQPDNLRSQGKINGNTMRTPFISCSICGGTNPRYSHILHHTQGSVIHLFQLDSLDLRGHLVMFQSTTLQGQGGLSQELGCITYFISGFGLTLCWSICWLTQRLLHLTYPPICYGYQ